MQRSPPHTQTYLFIQAKKHGRFDLESELGQNKNRTVVHIKKDQCYILTNTETVSKTLNKCRRPAAPPQFKNSFSPLWKRGSSVGR